MYSTTISSADVPVGFLQGSFKLGSANAASNPQYGSPGRSRSEVVLLAEWSTAIQAQPGIRGRVAAGTIISHCRRTPGLNG